MTELTKQISDTAVERHTVADEVGRRAAVETCHYATDADDARLLLTMLGLIGGDEA